MAQAKDEDRLDYAVIARVTSREEAEVLASCIRANGVDAFIGNLHHANVDWFMLPALNWHQVLAPAARRAEVKAIVRERVRAWREEPVVDPADDQLDEGPVRRRDFLRHFMLPAIIAFYAVGYWATFHYQR